MATEPTCEQRIEEYYKGRMATIGALVRLSEERASYMDMANLDEYADPDGLIDAECIIDEMPLSVEVIRTIKVLLGTGGPGDWFECRLEGDEGSTITRIDYHFNDWSDHAERNVTDDETARAFCERFVESALYAEQAGSGKDY